MINDVENNMQVEENNNSRKAYKNFSAPSSQQMINDVENNMQVEENNNSRKAYKNFSAPSSQQMINNVENNMQVEENNNSRKASKNLSAMHSKRSLASNERVVLSFHKISLALKDKSNKKKCSKQILNNVSGLMKPGLNAIMGPTGSGKSSLLDILAGRKDSAGLTGNVLINGSPLPPNFKRISGYVVQQDIVLGTLTVKENLWFSASLRLPRSVSIEKKKQRVDEILYDLGLTGCADSMIGTELIRGISGGEKKRACIGMELVTCPTVLFLDEPTTGLDASTANAVILLLKKLGHRGHTIILSIHQPRYSIFRLFDTLTLLSLGRLTYHGSNDQVLPYFEGLGYHCHKHNNPADFFLDIINGDSTALANVVENDYDVACIDSSSEGNETLAVKLEEKFKNSPIFKASKVELQKIIQNLESTKTTFNMTTYATPFHYQLKILLKRAFQNVLRNPLASIGTVVINCIFGVIFGSLFYQVDDTPTTGVQNRLGVMFFVIANLQFSSISAVEVFSKEKALFVHEYVSGYYMVISFFLAKLLADLIPLRTLGPIVFGTVTYWMVGLKSDIDAYLTFLVIVTLTSYASTSVALFYSACFDTFAVATIFISTTFIFSIMFAGLLLNVDSVLPWLRWIKYISMANYGYSGVAINEFQNSDFIACPAVGSCLGSENARTSTIEGNITCCIRSGEGFIKDSLSIGNGLSLTKWDLWSNTIGLICIMLVMTTLTYVRLSCTKTTT